jgi:hypothetical protein
MRRHACIHSAATLRTRGIGFSLLDYTDRNIYTINLLSGNFIIFLLQERAQIEVV